MFSLKQITWWITIWLTRAVFTSAACPTISNAITLQDVQDAAHASKEIYDDGLVEGNTIPGTTFKVTKLFHDQLQSDGEGIRVIVADSGNTRIIVYRGTDGEGKAKSGMKGDNIEQLLQQGSSVMFSGTQKWTVDGVETEVVKFFFQAYRLASFQLRPYLADSSKKYILIGHSLGGALASILALESTQILQGSVWTNPRSCLITFGQTRVGKSNYAMVHDRLISTYRKLRFIYSADPVPRLPPKELGWKHHSRAVFIRGEHLAFRGKRNLDSGELHSQMKSIDLNENYMMKEKRFLFQKRNYWQICGTGESASCVRHYYNFVPNVLHHLMANAYLYYVNIVPDYFLTRTGSKKSVFAEALINSCP